MELNKGWKGVCSVNRKGDLLDFQTCSSRRQGLPETYIQGTRV
jgi:hypothetical protein